MFHSKIKKSESRINKDYSKRNRTYVAAKLWVEFVSKMRGTKNVLGPLSWVYYNMLLQNCGDCTF